MYFTIVPLCRHLRGASQRNTSVPPAHPGHHIRAGTQIVVIADTRSGCTAYGRHGGR